MQIRLPILYKYIAREIFIPFLATLLVFTGVLFIGRSLNMVSLVVDKNVPIGDILFLFSLVIPRFLEFAVPMSLLLGVIIAFGRLSADSEIIVMRSIGLSVQRLAIPAMLVSAFIVLISLIISFWVKPWANLKLNRGMFEIARTQASSGLLSSVFNDFGQLTIYAEKIENSGEELSNVIIGDRTTENQPKTFFAKHGRLISDNQNRALTLQLFDGSIEEGKGKDFSVTHFSINNINLPFKDIFEDQEEKDGRRSSEMSITDLLKTINETNNNNLLIDENNNTKEFKLARLLIEFHRRIALPLSSLCACLLAVALGIQPNRGGHTWGQSLTVSVGIIVILIYYLLNALGGAIAEQTLIPVWILIWSPNILFLILGIYLIRQVGSERWLAVSEIIGDRIKQGGTFLNKIIERLYQ